jgi:chromatin licensing and DNA replication factor 1
VKEKVNGKSKGQLDALKAKINKLDYELNKLTTDTIVKDSTQSSISLLQTEICKNSTEKETLKEESSSVKKINKKKINSAELKQKIEQFNKNLLSIQTNNNPTEVQKDVSKECTNTVSKSQDDLPVYLKYKDLASSDLDPSSKLSLPKTYSLLLESFKGSDTILKMMFNRDEICTFLKLKLGIQNITKHNFTQQHLGQLKTVYPEAYIFRQEKLFIDFKNDYHLIISPNLNGLLFS